MLLTENCIFKMYHFVKAKPVLVLFSAFLFSAFCAHTQTSNISGIVNTYHKVTEIIPAKACIRVSSVAGLTASQTIMVIQMKGASVSTANNSSFGDTTSLNNAGNYELGVICGIRGDSVFLFFNLVNNYTISGKVQLVGIPTYYSAIVTDTLKALSWDNARGTGGVLAISVDETLTLNAPVYADSSGFSGGAYVLSNGTCSNLTAATGYIYNAATTTPQNGAYKGESVFDVTAAQSGGRAGVANGGGGGNNHNNGGGGGANLTVGGDGGGNSSSTGCTTNLKGLKGKALGSWNGKKIFSGGGGGAGHSNANFTVSDGGGNGGGIIFLRSKNIVSNNQKITANGGPGGPAVSDGASGGGGGGTIIADIETYSGSLTIEAKGGNGGTENDGGNTKRCYGAGGGGSGGAIYLTTGTPAITTSVAGGLAGAETGRDPACNAVVPANAGIAGITISNYAFTNSVSPSNYCSIIPLPLGVMFFKATLRDKQQVLLQWKTSDVAAGKQFIVERSASKDNWIAIGSLSPSSVSDLYELTDNNPAAGINFYRLKVTGPGNAVSYSALQRIYITGSQDRIIVYPNPAKDNIIIQGDLPATAAIKILSAEGKIILHKNIITNLHAVRLELPSLKPGIYFLQINTQVKKVIIR